MKLTDTQQAILGLIAERIEAEGVPPSQTEIARAFGFSSVRAAQYHLEALEAAGAIERVPGRARGIRVLAPVPGPQQALDLAVGNDDALHLPVLGQVAAGLPIGADIGSLNQRMNTAAPSRPKTIEGTAARLLMLTSMMSVMRFFGANSSR